MFYMKHCAPSIQALCFQWSHSNATKVNQTSKIRAILCEVLPAKISGVDTRLNLSIGRNIEHNIAPCIRALIFLSNHSNETKVDQTSKTRAVWNAISPATISEMDTRRNLATARNISHNFQLKLKIVTI